MRYFLPQTLLVAATLSTLTIATPQGPGQPAPAFNGCGGGENISISTVPDSVPPLSQPSSDYSDITTAVTLTNSNVNSSLSYPTATPTISTVPVPLISTMSTGPVSYNGTLNGTHSGLNGTGTISMNTKPTTSSQIGLLVATGNPSKTSGSGKPKQTTSGAMAMGTGWSGVVALVGVIGWIVSL